MCSCTFYTLSEPDDGCAVEGWALNVFFTFRVVQRDTFAGALGSWSVGFQEEDVDWGGISDTVSVYCTSRAVICKRAVQVLCQGRVLRREGHGSRFPGLLRSESKHIF